MVDTAPQATSGTATPAAQPAPNAPPAGAPLGGPPNAAQILQDQRAPQRTSLLDGLRGLRPGGESPAAPSQPPAAAAGSPQASAAPVAAPGTSPAAAAPSEVPVAGTVPAQPSQTPPASSTPDAGAVPIPSPTPETESPGMVQVRKAEQHMRQRLADERAQMQADFERQRSVWTQQVGELDRYKAIMANARQDPLALFTAAGFGDTDYEPLAQLAYAMSPEGQKDPRVAQGRKIAAHESLARRAQLSKQEQTDAEVRQIREELARRDAEAAAHANQQTYLQSVTRAIGDASPHARYAFGRAPEATQGHLYAIAERLYTESGPSNDLRDVPTPEQVLRAYEAERSGHIRGVIAELEALGIDPRAFGKPAAPAAQATAPPVAPPAQPAATPVQPAPVAPPAPTPSQPPAPQTDDQRRAATLEELRKLRFNGATA